jgi:hypothetical protein
MLVFMLETRRGTPDGFCIIRYHAGQEYDLPHSLAAKFLNEGWAAYPENFKIVKGAI